MTGFVIACITYVVLIGLMSLLSVGFATIYTGPAEAWFIVGGWIGGVLVILADLGKRL